MSRGHRFPIQSTGAIVLAFALAVTTASASQDILLDFSQLPSAQSFTYSAIGAHAGVAEASIFSVSGGVLTQNAIGQANGTAGGSILYQIPGIIAASESSEIIVTARCLQVQGTTNYPAGQGGLVFGLNNGLAQFAFSLTPTRVYLLGAGGWIASSATYDNTQFAEWTFRYDPPATSQVYRNGTLVLTATSGGAFSQNRLFFGDGSGGANARGEITAFHYLQGGAVDAESTSWGGVKALFR